MKKTYKKGIIIIAAVLVVALLGGCAATQPQQQIQLQAPETGTILLSVNPEIAVEFDENGLVLALEAKNDDASRILADFRDYQGKPCKEVMGQLVAEMYQAGYFQNPADGSQRNIVVKLENGSVCPTDTFLEDIAQYLHQVVQLCGETANTAAAPKATPQVISMEKAKELALAHFGLAAATFIDRECKLEEGKYELEFTANGTEYDCDVDAFTGRILKAEAEAIPAPPAPADPAPPTSTAPALLGMEKAKALALAHFGLAEATFIDRECKLEEGKYELEFTAGGMEYEIEIHAVTGQVLEADAEPMDFDD